MGDTDDFVHVGVELRGLAENCQGSPFAGRDVVECQEFRVAHPDPVATRCHKPARLGGGHQQVITVVHHQEPRPDVLNVGGIGSRQTPRRGTANGSELCNPRPWAGREASTLLCRRRRRCCPGPPHWLICGRGISAQRAPMRRDNQWGIRRAKRASPRLWPAPQDLSWQAGSSGWSLPHPGPMWAHGSRPAPRLRQEARLSMLQGLDGFVSAGGASPVVGQRDLQCQLAVGSEFDGPLAGGCFSVDAVGIYPDFRYDLSVQPRLPDDVDPVPSNRSLGMPVLAYRSSLLPGPTAELPWSWSLRFPAGVPGAVPFTAGPSASLRSPGPGASDPLGRWACFQPSAF